MNSKLIPNLNILDTTHVNDPIRPLSKNTLELRERIKMGPFQPAYEIYPRTKQCNKNRAFQKIWYTQYTWLEYSPAIDSAFCFPCRSFMGNQLNSGQLDDAFTKKGFKGWHRSHLSCVNHQKTKSLMNSVSAMESFLKSTLIDQVLDEEKKSIIKKREADRLHNRALMTRLIDISLFLFKGGLAFRGHEEKKIA